MVATLPVVRLSSAFSATKVAARPWATPESLSPPASMASRNLASMVGSVPPWPPLRLPNRYSVLSPVLEDTTLTMADGKPKLTLRVLDMVSPALEGIATPKLVRARAYSALRDFPRALASYDAAVKGGLDTPETDLGRARALYALGRPAEAAKAAMRALERNPRSAYANGLLAIMLAERGAMAQARELARRAAFLDPDEPQYQTMLAEMSGAKAAAKP